MPVRVSGRKARGQVRRPVPWAHPALAPWCLPQFPLPRGGRRAPIHHPCSRLRCCLGKALNGLNRARAEHHHQRDCPKGKARQQQANTSGGREPLNTPHSFSQRGKKLASSLFFMSLLV